MYLCDRRCEQALWFNHTGLLRDRNQGRDQDNRQQWVPVECVKTISYSLSLVCSVSSVFSVQFNQFSKKTQNLTVIDIKYVLYHNKHFFLYKKGPFLQTNMKKLFLILVMFAQKM